jgi:hypothetical protein
VNVVDVVGVDVEKRWARGREKRNISTGATAR